MENPMENPIGLNKPNKKIEMPVQVNKIECDRNGADFLTCISSNMETQRSKTQVEPQIKSTWDDPGWPPLKKHQDVEKFKTHLASKKPGFALDVATFGGSRHSGEINITGGYGYTVMLNLTW